MRPRLPAQDPSDHEHHRPPSVVRPDLVTMAPTAQHPHPEVLAEVGRERLHLGEVVDLAKGLLNLARLGRTPDVVPRQRCAHRDLTVALPLHAGGFQRPPRRGEGIARPSLSQGRSPPRRDAGGRPGARPSPRGRRSRGRPRTPGRRGRRRTAGRRPPTERASRRRGGTHGGAPRSAGRATPQLAYPVEEHHRRMPAGDAPVAAAQLRVLQQQPQLGEALRRRRVHPAPGPHTSRSAPSHL